MACTRSSRPSLLFYLKLACIIIALALLCAVAYYVLDTREQVDMLEREVSENTAKVATIPAFLFEMELADPDAVQPAAGPGATASTIPTPRKMQPALTYVNVELRIRTSWSPKTNSTAFVSFALAHLVGRSVLLPETNNHVLVNGILPDDTSALVIDVCVDSKTARRIKGSTTSVMVLP